MEQARKDELMKLAEEILNPNGQAEIANDLDDGKERHAQYYLLGALDRQVQDGDFTAEEAAPHYRIIGLPVEEIAQFRQLRSSS